MSDQGRLWLKQELPLWEAEGLLSADQADALREKYQLDTLGEGGVWRHLISGAGAILIGLGVILLFAYNWEAMSRGLKLAVIFGALILAHGSGFVLLERHRLLAEGLFAIGSMMMGAGIFLVGQIYHLGGRYPDALLLWSLGVMGLAWALGSRIQAWMTLILVMVWHLSEVFDFGLPNEWVLLPLAVLFPLLWRLDSALLAKSWSMMLLVAVTSVLIARGSDALLPVLLSLTVVMIALPTVFKALDLPRVHLAEALSEPASTALILFLLSITLESFSWELLHRLSSSGHEPLFWMAVIVSQVTVVSLWLRLRHLEGMLWLAEGVWMLVLVPQLLEWALGAGAVEWVWPLQTLLVNLLMLGLSLWMMISGAREVKRQRMMQGAALFVALVLVRYLDLFDSLIARGLVFLLVGVGLFALSHWYRRNQERSAS